MDQTMAQLLAQRLGATTEETTALESGDLSSVLTNRVSDPVMAALMTSMMRSKPSSEAADEDVCCERVAARARRIIRELKADLAAADATIGYFAEVFGACTACLGHSDSCARCAGNGQPGSAPPLADELLAWVNPALNRLGMRAVRI
jgi:hypothetical protein